ncbi:hypothetical protein LOK49_LG15G02175 [Camellia lanceoleosa]|uniref:Uncharacterized protein n=1 Tax=Camellia lanceoleosa TaxID=1840588 RepID=A0ACC0F613_9ERIC|nr:hypothetical protein LOK49_LG15G02175 [Camellia lanceoleosa]
MTCGSNRTPIQWCPWHCGPENSHIDPPKVSGSNLLNPKLQTKISYWH